MDENLVESIKNFFKRVSPFVQVVLYKNQNEESMNNDDEN